MNSKLAFILGLVAGGAAGTFAAWRILKTKYKKIADEEIASMKEVLARKIAEEPKDETESEEAPAKIHKVPEVYVEMTKKYTNGDELGVSEDQKPYIIDPDEFGDHEEYDTETLVYYSDGILAHFQGDIVEDVAGTVGTDALTKFGINDNDPDTVYVRNDVRGADYEILRDEGKFTDIFQDDTEE